MIMGLAYGRRYLLEQYKDLEHRNDLNYFILNLLGQLHSIEEELEELLKEKSRQVDK